MCGAQQLDESPLQEPVITRGRPPAGCRVNTPPSYLCTTTLWASACEASEEVGRPAVGSP